MRIIKRAKLEEFWQVEPAAAGPLGEWYRLTRRSNWKDFPAVRQTFGQTDVVRVASGKSVYVFDIGGNKYRLVARVSHNKEKVYVLRVMTHQDYDRKRWIQEL